MPKHASRTARDNRVVGNIAGDHGARGDDGAVADLNARHHYRFEPHPDIIADDSVSPVVERRSVTADQFRVELAEWVCGKPVHGMIGGTGDDTDAVGDLAEFANGEALRRARIEVGHECGRIICGRFKARIIAVVADCDVWGGRSPNCGEPFLYGGLPSARMMG